MTKKDSAEAISADLEQYNAKREMTVAQQQVSRVETASDLSSLIGDMRAVPAAKEALGILDQSEQKSLIGKNMLILRWRFGQSEFEPDEPLAQYATCVFAVFPDGVNVLDPKLDLSSVPVLRSGRFTDGSWKSGIAQQLRDYTETMLSSANESDRVKAYGPMYCPNGTKASNYQWTDPTDGKKKPATTHYIAGDED